MIISNKKFQILFYDIAYNLFMISVLSANILYWFVYDTEISLVAALIPSITTFNLNIGVNKIFTINLINWSNYVIRIFYIYYFPYELG